MPIPAGTDHKQQAAVNDTVSVAVHQFFCGKNYQQNHQPPGNHIQCAVDAVNKNTEHLFGGNKNLAVINIDITYKFIYRFCYIQIDIRKIQQPTCHTPAPLLFF